MNVWEWGFWALYIAAPWLAMDAAAVRVVKFRNGRVITKADGEVAFEWVWPIKRVGGFNASFIVLWFIFWPLMWPWSIYLGRRAKKG